MIELRYVRRKVTIDPFYQPSYTFVNVLQYRQMLLSVDASGGLCPGEITEWKDVPVVEEEQ